MAGKVWLVGAGPSDGGLLTLKGKAVLEQAEVVVFDALVGPEILAWIPPQAEKINTPKGFFTPPFETADSLRQRLEELYAEVTLETVESMACFRCKKGA